MSSTNTTVSDAAPATTVDDDDDDDDDAARAGGAAPETRLGAGAASTTTATTSPPFVHDQLSSATLLARLSLRAPAPAAAAAAHPSPTHRAYPYIVVDSDSKLQDVATALRGASRVALDAEGVDLSRVGPLTLLSLKRLDDGARGAIAPVYLIDVLALGGRRVFASDSALRRLIEARDVVKVTFDCRSDSDALWHQFDVRLENVLDLQVYDQGVRAHRGERPAQRDGSRVPFVSGMAKVAPRYVAPSVLRELDAPAPHKTDPRAWMRRPLPDSACAYAANDVHLIEAMLRAMDAARVSPRVMDRVNAHSQRYADVFRAHRQVVRWETHKRLVMEAVSIWSDA